jgi:hypothetical protein
MKSTHAKDRETVERRLARRRFAALSSLALIAVLALGIGVASGATSLATRLLRDAQAIYRGSHPQLAANHRAHRRRPAAVSGHNSVGAEPARGPRTLPEAPAAGPAPTAEVTPAPESIGTAAPQPSASPAASGSPPNGAEPPASEAPPVTRGSGPPGAESEEPAAEAEQPAAEPEPPATEAPGGEQPASEPGAPSEEAEAPAGGEAEAPAGEPEPPAEESGQPTEPPPAETGAPGEPPGAPGEVPFFAGRKIDDFDLIQEAPNAITEVPDPLGSGEKVLKMTVGDGDVAPITPTDNPRAQALSPAEIEPGQELWLETKFLVPEGFPNVTGWMSLISIYGPPFQSSSPWQVEVIGNHLQWTRNRTYGFDVPWEAPLPESSWVTVLLHERFASDGFVEMWIDGQPVVFFSGNGSNPSHHAATTKLEMETADSSNDEGANAAKIMQYREEGMFETATVYFGPLLLGGTRAAVEDGFLAQP